MRLKNVPGSQDKINESPFVIPSPEDYAGKWNEFFGNENPLHIEIGMGKGRFITEMAQEHPEINYLGIEKYSSVLIRALEKRSEVPCDNLYFLCYDAENIEKIFSHGEVSGIYLNFSDPWPKLRHAKRRLTSTHFLDKYKLFLKPDGCIAFKTDNRDLFDFSVEQCSESGWKVSELTYDLHNSEYAVGNIMTEYEQKFSAAGNPICRLKATYSL